MGFTINVQIGGWNVALGRGNRRLPEDKLRSGGSRLGGLLIC
jgi:hypothetical protein